MARGCEGPGAGGWFLGPRGHPPACWSGPAVGGSGMGMPFVRAGVSARSTSLLQVHRGAGGLSLSDGGEQAGELGYHPRPRAGSRPLACSARPGVPAGPRRREGHRRIWLWVASGRLCPCLAEPDAGDMQMKEPGWVSNPKCSFRRIFTWHKIFFS